MMFRKLYWVVERSKEIGGTHVHGVYTSIPDLIRRGIGDSSAADLHLTLVKLDSDQAPLGTWRGPDFSGMEQKLVEFIQTDEFSSDQVEALLERLSLVHAKSA